MTNDATSKARFCSECGARLLPDASFCQSCGAPAGGSGGAREAAPASSPLLRWALPAVAVIALVALTFFKLGARERTPETPPGTPLASAGMSVPDIASMSPEERANRLFNRVMTLWSEGKSDSAMFFAPMALSSIEALAPLDAHERYDLGLVALVAGDFGKAAAESDTILAQRPTHLLGLILAARVADARRDSTAANAVRKRLLDAEKSERAAALPEYRDHEADLSSAIDAARKR